MTRHRALPVLSVMVALGAAAPARADTVAAHLTAPTKVRAYAGVQVFSLFDGGAYRLAIRRDGAVRSLPVAPSGAPFDVDIGPDRHGRPELVYTRCKREIRADERNLNRGCDLVALSLVGGGERPVRSANTAANEFAPTVWKGRIAFARAAVRRERPVVYVTRPGVGRAQRVPGVPRRARGARTTDGGIDELELHGDRLAQIVSYEAAGQVTDVRLVDVAHRRSRLLARVGVGEGGQFFTGVGFADGYVAWAYSWVAGGGELVPGVYRERLSSGDVSRADFSRLAKFEVVGLAPFAADGAYLTTADLPSGDGCGGEEGSPSGTVCELIRSAPLHFRPVPGRRA